MNQQWKKEARKHELSLPLGWVPTQAQRRWGDAQSGLFDLEKAAIERMKRKFPD